MVEGNSPFWIAPQSWIRGFKQSCHKTIKIKAKKITWVSVRLTTYLYFLDPSSVFNSQIGVHSLCATTSLCLVSYVSVVDRTHCLSSINWRPQNCTGAYECLWLCVL